MMISIWAALGLFVAVYIAWWALKRLFAHYLVVLMEKRRVCIPCLRALDPKVVLHSEWVVKDSKGTVPICDSCKNKLFPAEIGQAAEEMGVLIKVIK